MQRKLIFFLGLFYLVGIVGMSISSIRSFFVDLSFFHLLLSFLVLLFSRKKYGLTFWMFLGLSFLIGMAAEWVGVHTGLLFGNYHYGSVLGPKILAVPFIIGMNWAMLSIISAALIEKLNLKAWLEILIAAVLMVFLDFLMEPVAMKLHFWNWKNQEIPLYNYVCWLAISILIQALYKRWHLNETNKVAIALFFFLTAFFSILNLQL
ncbi:MAG: hypothetical protein RLZZ65_1908 [Bacteroidota bacterium]